MQESCGQVDKQEAVAYLINDALRRPIIPKGPEPGWPRKVGQASQIQASKAKHKVSEDAKAAAKKVAAAGEQAKHQARMHARAAVMQAESTLHALPKLPKLSNSKRKSPEQAPEHAPEQATEHARRASA